MNKLDKFVNEIIRGGTDRIVGAEGIVEKMGQCRLTRSHIPDEVLEVLFGEQLLSPADISSMSAVEIKNIFAPGEEMLKPMADKWLGKQTTVSDGSFTKTIHRSKNHLKPDIADIIRKRLSQVLEILFPMTATMICDQILATSKWVQGMLVAAGYAIGTTSTEEGATASIDISESVKNVYIKIANRYYTNPALNFNMVSELRPVDFLFFPKTSSAISTRMPQNITIRIVNEDVNNLKSSISKIRSLSATERLFEDFFDAAFSATPGRINRTQLRETVTVEINEINKKLLGLQSSALDEIRTELASDYMIKSDAVVKNIQRLIMIMNPPDGSKILSRLSSF